MPPGGDRPGQRPVPSNLRSGAGRREHELAPRFSEIHHGVGGDRERDQIRSGRIVFKAKLRARPASPTEADLFIEAKKPWPVVCGYNARLFSSNWTTTAIERRSLVEIALRLARSAAKRLDAYRSHAIQRSQFRSMKWPEPKDQSVTRTPPPISSC